MEYSDRPVWIISGQVITNENSANKIYQQLSMQRQQVMAQKMAEFLYSGYSDKEAKKLAEEEVPEIEIENLTYKDLIEQGQIEIVKITCKKVKQCVIMGDTKLYSRVLPLEHYPVVPIFNIHTRTPYPMSDVRVIKPLQEYINKTRSLIIAHATTSTNTKILVPEGSVDMKDFEEKWSQPGVAISYDPTDGAPMPVQPTPLPNELYQNEITAKNDIDHQIGRDERMQGNSAAAPKTYKDTID